MITDHAREHFIERLHRAVAAAEYEPSCAHVMCGKYRRTYRLLRGLLGTACSGKVEVRTGTCAGRLTEYVVRIRYALASRVRRRAAATQNVTTNGNANGNGNGNG